MSKNPMQIFTTLNTTSKLLPSSDDLTIKIRPYYYEVGDGGNFGNFYIQKPLTYEHLDTVEHNFLYKYGLVKSHYCNNDIFVNILIGEVAFLLSEYLE